MDLRLDDDEEEEKYIPKFISDRDFIMRYRSITATVSNYYSYSNSINGWISTIIEKDIRTQEEFTNTVEFSDLKGGYFNRFTKYS